MQQLPKARSWRETEALGVACKQLGNKSLLVEFFMKALLDEDWDEALNLVSLWGGQLGRDGSSIQYEAAIKVNMAVQMRLVTANYHALYRLLTFIDDKIISYSFQPHYKASAQDTIKEIEVHPHVIEAAKDCAHMKERIERYRGHVNLVCDLSDTFMGTDPNIEPDISAIGRANARLFVDFTLKHYLFRRAIPCSISAKFADYCINRVPNLPLLKEYIKVLIEDPSTDTDEHLDAMWPIVGRAKHSRPGRSGIALEQSLLEVIPKESRRDAIRKIDVASQRLLAFKS
jgi:hypothetical protein